MNIYMDSSILRIAVERFMYLKTTTILHSTADVVGLHTCTSHVQPQNLFQCHVVSDNLNHCIEFEYSNLNRMAWHNLAICT